MNLGKLLAEASVEERARILKAELEDRREDLERFNGGTILDVDTFNGLSVGDPVSYVNALGERSYGWVSHFHLKPRSLVPAAAFARDLAILDAQANGREYRSNGEMVATIIRPNDGPGYAMHHGTGGPKKFDE